MIVLSPICCSPSLPSRNVNDKHNVLGQVESPGPHFCEHGWSTVLGKSGSVLDARRIESEKTSNKCHASSNRCLTSSNKKLFHFTLGWRP